MIRQWRHALLAGTLALAACGAGGDSGSGGGSSGGGSSGGGTTPPPTITIDTTSSGPAIGADVIGSNLAAWFDITTSGTLAAQQQLGEKLLRWPGGSASDTYHWQTHTTCNGQYVAPASTFDAFVADVVKPGHFDLALTMNYGSNASCNGGGDPAEAAAWVAHAKAQGLTGLHWTVGNEVYGSGWEYDLHASAHDPATYAAAVAGTNGYYALAKAADSTAQIGVVVQGVAAWDTTVLAQASYDFVELHYYAQAPGSESDSYLLGQGVSNLTQLINTVKSELVAAGKPNTPIYMGEFNSVYSQPGKQSVSIINGLYAGMAIGEVLNAGLPMATWWQGIGAGCSGTNNNASSLYGWQSFGSYGQLADTWSPSSGCGLTTTIPLGTPMPSGRAMALAAQFVADGQHMLTVSLPAGLANVRAYALSRGGKGYALMLFNLDGNTSVTIAAQLAGATASGFTMTTATYGKAQYDQSQTNVWPGPATTVAAKVSTSPTLSLPPYSMTVVQLQ